MANVVDDRSADPARRILEPERASGEPLGPVEPPGSSARTAVLRQGLPRTAAYRASAVKRSMHPTPVATPIVTIATTLVATPIAAQPAEAAVASAASGDTARAESTLAAATSAAAAGAP